MAASRSWPSRSASSFRSTPQIEEEIFYPACEGKVDEDLLKESYVEHDARQGADRRDRGRQRQSDEFFDAKVKVLSEEIEHHVEEEEKRMEGLFAAGAQGRPRHGCARRAARGAQEGS